MNRTETANDTRRLTSSVSRYAILALILFAVLLLLFVKPAFPDRIALLTGPEGSAYHELGLRYAEDLTSRGLEVDVVVTDGTFDNVLQVLDRENAVAFAPSAINWDEVIDADVSTLTAIGSVAFEPLWLFYRSNLAVSQISDLTDWSVFTEGEGTASHYVAELLLELNGLQDQVELRSVGKNASAGELIQRVTAGDIDALFLTGHPRSARLQEMLLEDGLQFMSFDRAEAYSARLPGVTSLMIPEGMVDLARNIPETNSSVLSKTTCLIACEDLHPTVVSMLLVTAERVRPSEIKYPDAESFPNQGHVNLPLHPGARRFFKLGEVGLSRYLPYNVARFINHLGFFVLPLITGLLLIAKAVPATLKVWSNFRLKRMFKQLESIEKRCAAGEDSAKLLVDLEQVSQASASMFIPMALSPDYVDFRQFVHDMKDRVESMPSSPKESN